MLPIVRLDLLVEVASFALALGISALLTPLVAAWARAHAFVAAPRKDRWHTQPTPLLGGVAIYVATMVVVLAFSDIDRRLVGLLTGGSILFITGLIDDRRRLRPQTKLIIQILAACILPLSGIQVETSNMTAIAIPLTILWAVGLTNAFNLLDNMDGLSSGTAVIACFFLGALSVSIGNDGFTVLCLAVGGAALGFLFYNFNPARIFMGDSGSMFLGFMLSGIALLGSRAMASDVFFVLLVPVAMMGLPIFDTTLVTVMRTLEGRPLAQGGRDHLSHRLVALGLSERRAVLVLYVLAAGFGSLGLIARSVGMWASIAAGGALLVVILLLGAYLAQVRIYSPAQFAEAEQTNALADRTVLNGMIMFKREIGLVMIDAILVCVCYVGAYVLKYGVPTNGAGTGGFVPLPAVFAASFPIVLLVKLGTLLLFRVYRGMWRYIGVADIMTLIKASVASSVLLALLLPLVMRELIVPKSVILIDWLLFSTLIAGSRVSFTALTDTFVHMQSQRVPHLLIVGAGDLGELVLRSVIRSRPAGYDPVGFLDDDSGKWNRSIHGVRVLGSLAQLEQVSEKRGVDLVVLALPRGAADTTDMLRARCSALNVNAYSAASFMELHFAGALSITGSDAALPAPTATLVS